MTQERIAAVFDSNIFLQAMISPAGPAGQAKQCVERGEVVLFVSDPVLQEARDLRHDRYRAQYGNALQEARDVGNRDFVRRRDAGPGRGLPERPPEQGCARGPVVLQENPVNRYNIAAWMPLTYNPDGSLDVYIQKDSPGKDKESNWLPAAAGEFSITMRVYWPKPTPPSIIDGTWKPPAVKRVE